MTTEGIEKKTTITLYDPFFEAGDPGVFGIGGNRDEVRGLILAHEIGHVLGLDDVYRAQGDPDDWPVVDDALMGNVWLADESSPTLDSAGVPDLNGVSILQRTPWYQVGTTLFYWESPGVFKSGWLDLGGNRYYFRPDSLSPSLELPFSMVTGLQSIDGSWCLFSPSGEMVTGWYTGDGGLRYYFESDGSRSYGWRTIGGATYYFGGFNDGSMRKGWQTIEGHSYYFGTDGRLQDPPPPPRPPTTNHFGNETVDTQPAPPSSLLKTYGVRGGSAGPDFLGITNTNYSFPAGSAGSPDQYTGTTPTDLQGHAGAGLALWATSVNETVNPYYANLYYDILTGSNVTPRATTWMSNDASVSSWGDSNGSASHVGNVPGGAATIAGLEYNPQIIFGANKYTNWNLASDGSNSDTNIYDSGYDATYVTNDATNIWSQVYTMRQLAYAADGMSGTTTRYNSGVAAASAQNYERAIKGNLRYVASRIDANAVARKTVAYLYAIDADGTGYFFTPTAAGLTGGDDTGAAPTTATTPDDNYAANDSTISYGFRATLPFVTNTFDSGVPFAGGIVMRVEDIYKASPVCTVSSSASSALSGVDTIIYNSTMYTDLNGTSRGRNVSGVDNDYQGTPLNTTKVSNWAAAHGFAGSRVIAGDDFGTSSQQGYGTRVADAEGMAPVLYCQDDFTADKNARAAWAFSQVYPELYGDNPNATYAYWVDKVYHVRTADVPAVVAYMTNQNDTVTYDESAMNGYIEAGLDWWYEDGQDESVWNRYAYYNGSSRASYYSGNPASAEPADTIGILAE